MIEGILMTHNNKSLCVRPLKTHMKDLTNLVCIVAHWLILIPFRVQRCSVRDQSDDSWSRCINVVSTAPVCQSKNLDYSTLAP